MTIERRPEKAGAASSAGLAHAAAGKASGRAAPKKVIELFTDGACSGNPGPGGWAAILRSGPHESELSGAEAQTTNNRMELTAVIEGLRAIKKPSHVLIHTDSRYVMDGAKSWLAGWKVRGWKTADKKPVKNEDLWRALDAQKDRHLLLEWTWVRGHSGHVENERADVLARSAILTLRSKGS